MGALLARGQQDPAVPSPQAASGCNRSVSQDNILFFALGWKMTFLLVCFESTGCLSIDAASLLLANILTGHTQNQLSYSFGEQAFLSK